MADAFAGLANGRERDVEPPSPPTGRGHPRERVSPSENETEDNDADAQQNESRKLAKRGMGKRGREGSGGVSVPPARRIRVGEARGVARYAGYAVEPRSAHARGILSEGSKEGT
jgi:hypothetical protein